MRRWALLIAVCFVLGSFGPALAGHGGPASIEHIDGYYDTVGRWVPGLISNETWLRGHPMYSTGRALFYAPGVMEATARYRGYSLGGYLDGVSLMSPTDLGKTVWLRRDGSVWEGPFLVVDCSAQTDLYTNVIHNREVVEVGFKTAVRWGMAQPAGNDWGYRTLHPLLESVEVALVKERPTDFVPIPPIDYPEWWTAQVRFTDGLEPVLWMYDGRWFVGDKEVFIREQEQRLDMPAYFECVAAEYLYGACRGVDYGWYAGEVKAR